MNRRQERYYSVAPHISTTAYTAWEIKRHLDSQTPGKYGWFTAEDVK